MARLKFHPVTPDKWKDFETLFGERGACAGCWCTYWRLNRSEFEKGKGAGNKRVMKAIIGKNRIPGILAFLDNKPVGWCSVAPREEFPVLERSRILKPVDENPVWSVSCFFVDKRYRNKGITVELLREAIRYVKKQGGRIVEGYPVEAKNEKMPPVFAWTGFASAFLKAGFKEVARRSETRPIMHYVIGKANR